MNTSTRTQSSSPKTARLHRHTDGTIHALSSDGHTRYVVTIGLSPSCDCPAGERGLRCYHLTTAEATYAAFYALPDHPEPPTPTAPASRPVARISDLYGEAVDLSASSAARQIAA